MSNTKTDAEKSLFVYVKDTNTDVVKRLAIPCDVQIGLAGNPSELQLNGAFSISTLEHVVVGNNGTANVSSDTTAVNINVSSAPASGRINVYLPTRPRDGQIHIIKDSSGTSATTPIDIFPAPGILIDGSTSKTLSTAYDSAVVYWMNNAWYNLIISTGGGGGGSGAPTNATYVVISNDATLTAERALAVGSNLSLTDAGANSTVTLNLSSILGAGAGTFIVPTVTADAFGRITAISQPAVLGAGAGSYTNANITADTHGRITAISNGAAPLPKIDNLSIVAGNQIVDQVIFQAIGAVEFTPTGAETMMPSGSVSYTVHFQPIVEIFPTGVTLETQLFNVTTNAYITNSLLSCSALTATALRSINLSGSLASGKNLYEMHMRITNAGAGKAICKGAKLFITWR